MLAEAADEVAAAYRQPGLRVSDLLGQLVQARTLGVGPSGNATHYSPRLHWLQPYGQRPAGAAPAPARQRVALRLPPKHAPAAGAAGTSRGPAAPAADAVEVLLRLPPEFGKKQMSRSNGVKVLADGLTQLLPGAPAPLLLKRVCKGCGMTLRCCCVCLRVRPVGTLTACTHPVAPCCPWRAVTSAASALQRLAVISLLHVGLTKSGPAPSGEKQLYLFCQRPVLVREAQQALEAQLATKDRARLPAAYRQQFGGSLLALLQTPQLAPLVRLQHGAPAPAVEPGWQAVRSSSDAGLQVQLLLGQLQRGLDPGRPAQQQQQLQQWETRPAADDLADELEGWSFDAAQPSSSGAGASTALPAPAPLPPPAPAASRLAAGSPAIHLVSSEGQTAVAVDVLLAAPGGQVALAYDRQAGGPGMLVALLPPAEGAGSGGIAYGFDLAALLPLGASAVMRQLSRLLQSPQPIKACVQRREGNRGAHEPAPCPASVLHPTRRCSLPTRTRTPACPPALHR